MSVCFMMCQFTCLRFMHFSVCVVFLVKTKMLIKEEKKIQRKKNIVDWVMTCDSGLPLVF